MHKVFEQIAQFFCRIADKTGSKIDNSLKLQYGDGKSNKTSKEISFMFLARLRFALMIVLVSAAAAVPIATSAQAQVKDVPRNRTLISQGWDFYNQVPSPTNFNPYAGATLHGRNNLHYTVYESLFYSNYPKGEIVPWIGEKWEYNADYTQLTVTLRKGVTWSDGKPLTADDVVFSLDMLKKNAPKMLYSTVIEGSVDSAQAVDPQTVVIKLKKPSPRWAVENLATGQAGRFVVVPKHIWDGQDAQTFANFDLEKGWPVGTGPYKMVKAGADSVFFDRRDTWWAVETGLAPEMPAVERIVYVPATVEAMANLYINNDLDMGRSIPVGAFEAARAQNPNLLSWNPEGPVWGAPDGCNYRLTFNSQTPPFDDPAIRRAINFAIDREQMVQLAYEGSTTPNVAPLASYESVKAYTAQLQSLIDSSGVGKKDLQKTEELLAGKGYTKKEGRFANDKGESLKITIQMSASDPAGPVLVQQLKDAGFDATFEALQEAAFQENARTGNFGAHLWVHCGSTYDPYLTLEHYHSKYALPKGQSQSNVRSYTRYANKDLDALLDKMEQMVPSPTDPAYMDLVQKAMTIYLNDLPDITLAEELQVVVFNSNYWTGWPSSSDPYMHAYIPWEGFNRVIHKLKPRQ
jgi:peptide/nickel transport system substrate-binding protein